MNFEFLNVKRVAQTFLSVSPIRRARTAKAVGQTFLSAGGADIPVCHRIPCDAALNRHVYPTRNPQRTSHNATHNAGFSFAEVMFAVVILGIGFIMVAAVFPVAIKQGQATSEESFTATIARNGSNYLDPLGQRAPVTFPSGAIVHAMFATDLMINAGAVNPPKGTAEQPPPALRVPANGSLTSRGKLIALGDLRLFEDGDNPLIEMQRREGTGNAIVADDNRFAWVPMYRRDRTYTNRTGGSLSINDANVGYEDAAVAQVILFGVAIRNRTVFDNRDLPKVQEINGQRKQFNLQPRPVAVRIQPETAYNPSGDASTYVVEIFSVTALNGTHARGGYPVGTDYTNILNAAPTAIDAGSFFVISDDRIVRDAIADPLSSKIAGDFNGRIYRVGSQRTDLTTPAGSTLWDFFPGYEFTPDTGADGLPQAGVATRPFDDIIGLGIQPPAAAVTVSGVVYRSAVQVDGTAAGQGAVAFIMGKGMLEADINPIVTSPPRFEGLPMDVSVYTTVMKVK